MAAMEIVAATGGQDSTVPLPKRFKTSELPLSVSQRTSIDNLLHTIKKKGEFDALRKKIWSLYTDSDAKIAFTQSLTELADSEIDREPSLLSRDRGKAATLIEGAVDRSDLYKTVEATIESLIAANVGHVENAAREIRRLEIGAEAAADEERLGAKTDAEYAQEAAIRREARTKIRKQEESRKRREEEMERLRAEEKQKKLELEELRRADERRREEEAKEERRKKERDARRAAEKQAQEAREAERRERYEKRKTEDSLWDHSRARSRSADRTRSLRRDDDRTAKSGDSGYTPRGERQGKQSPLGAVSAPIVDEKALEEAALELLLKEGRELAAKSGPKTDVERSESLEPPIRPGHSSKSRKHDSSKTKEPSRSPIRSEVKSRRRSRSRDRIPTRKRSLSKDSRYRDSRRHHSRSKSRHRDSERRKADLEAKEAYKQSAARQREREAGAWKRSAAHSEETETEKAKVTIMAHVATPIIVLPHTAGVIAGLEARENLPIMSSRLHDRRGQNRPLRSIGMSLVEEEAVSDPEAVIVTETETETANGIAIETMTVTVTVTVIVIETEIATGIVTGTGTVIVIIPGTEVGIGTENQQSGITVTEAENERNLIINTELTEQETNRGGTLISIDTYRVVHPGTMTASGESEIEVRNEAKPIPSLR
ncbi:hypothetical protein MMC09_003256 [Bachmanniomyces sp. S44760]|nr:hypothetical protein [Bachmanniomyces sp. S44760]